jgi:hypothetical protein
MNLLSVHWFPCQISYFYFWLLIQYAKDMNIPFLVSSNLVDPLKGLIIAAAFERSFLAWTDFSRLFSFWHFQDTRHFSHSGCY